MDMDQYQAAQGVALSRLRQNTGLPLRRVSAKSGINFSSLSRKENGETPVSGPELAALLLVYGCSRDRFDRMVREIIREENDRLRPPGIPVIGAVPGGQITLHWQTHDNIDAVDEFLERGGQPSDAVALRVQGVSMAPRIDPGDKIVCRPVPMDADEMPLVNNELVVVSLSDDADEPGSTLGYWTALPGGGGFVIRKHNPAFDMIPINPEHVVRVLRVVEIRKPVLS